MASVTIRNLPEVTHRALKMRAASNHRSLEAEIREILKDAVAPARRVKGAKPSPSKIKIGSELAAFGRRFGGIDLKID
ncbi:MAG: plasmid stability protein [Terracidiphilus sp.]